VQKRARLRLLTILAVFWGFVARQLLLGDSLEALEASDSVEALSAWVNAAPRDQVDFRRCLRAAEVLQLEQLGRGINRLGFSRPDEERGQLSRAGHSTSSGKC
jgi:hypothetical protein